MRSKLIYIIFAICLVMAGIVVAILFAESVPDAGGRAHPEFSGMQQGGDGAARLVHIGWLGYLFQCLLLILTCCLCTLGVAERLRTKQLYAYLGGCLIFMLLAWQQMYAGHQEFLATGTTGYFMGFPTATAWQVYGTWLGAIPLIVIYSLGFRKFVYTHEDEEKFDQLIAEQTARSAISGEGS